MTNHIEQLMKAAGVQKREIIDCCSIQEYYECQDKHNCANCDKCRSIEYPAFTPEKQLELIKLLPGFGCQRELNDVWVLDYINAVANKGFRIHNQFFEDTLAELIINLIDKDDK